MATTLDLIVEDMRGKRPVAFPLERIYHLGFTVRDPAVMKRHMEEIEREGIPFADAPEKPVIFQMSDWTATTASEITVQGSKTSGEVEFVVLLKGQEFFITVGSDQTDRDLERISVPWAKQVCQDVICPAVWPMGDLVDHWEQLVLESEVVAGQKTIPYQRESVGAFMHPREMADFILAKVPAAAARGIALYSGTVPTLHGKIEYGDVWTIRLIDPVLRRKVEHRYKVIVLEREV